MSVGTLVRRKLIDPIRRAQGTPESIARGGAVGMWVAMTPTVGVQMVVATLLAVPLRGNVPVALAMCWITNPLTVVPFYFVFYWLGAVVLGRPAESFAAVAEVLDSALSAVGEAGLAEGVMVLGQEILWPMLVGSVIIATASAVPTYHLLLWSMRRRRARILLQRLEAGEPTRVEDIDRSFDKDMTALDAQTAAGADAAGDRPAERP